MKERTIIFSGETVRAILAGRKTQMRRVIKGLPYDITDGPRYWSPPGGKPKNGWADPGVNYWTPRGNHIDPCPYGVPGDRLWVREEWCNITLEVVNVRVERVQQISEEDAIAEGGPRGYELYQSNRWRNAREWFRDLWDSINAKRGFGWETNPWVWVVEFKRVEGR